MAASGMPNHEEVWEKYGGDTPTKICPVCRTSRMDRDIHSGEDITGCWERGHMRSRKNEGSDDISNLAPICFTCNRECGSANLVPYAKAKGYAYDKSIIKNRHGVRDDDSCTIL